METSEAAVCEECGYNRPHHDQDCSQHPPTVDACPDHAPTGARRLGMDDARLRCHQCGDIGQHVSRFQV